MVNFSFAKRPKTFLLVLLAFDAYDKSLSLFFIEVVHGLIKKRSGFFFPRERLNGVQHGKKN